MQMGRVVQRLLAVILALSMTIASTASAYAAPPVGSYIQSSAEGSHVVQARFISPDTMDPTIPGVGTNRYAYSDNDPINKSDPNGHVWGAVVGFTVGLLSSLFGGTKEANAPGPNDTIANRSDTQQMLGMAAGAAGGTIGGKAAGNIAEGLFGTATSQKQTAKEIVDTERKTTTLYRAVNNEELAGIKETGRFSVGKNTMEGKWFAESAEDAATWGNKMNGIDKSTVVRVEVPTEQANKFFRTDRLDGIGPARYADLPQLDGVKIHW